MIMTKMIHLTTRSNTGILNKKGANMHENHYKALIWLKIDKINLQIIKRLYHQGGSFKLQK